MTKTTETTTTWRDDRGTLLLQHTAGDKEPYWILDNFFTRDRLRRLLKALREALEDGEAT